MKLMFQKNKKGFSLVELLIVLAIMTIMTGVVFATKNGDKKASVDVEAATRDVAAQIRSLQNEALNGKMIGTIPACSFKFAMANGDTKYSVSYFSDCSATTIIGAVKDINFNSKKTVKANSANSFYFSAPQGTVSASQKIGLESLSDSSVKGCVVVSANGSVTENKGVCL